MREPWLLGERGARGTLSPAPLQPGGCSGEQGAKVGPPACSQQTALYRTLPLLAPSLAGELAMVTRAASSRPAAAPAQSQHAGLAPHPALARCVSVGEGPDPAEKQPWDVVGNGWFKTKRAPRPGQLCSHANSYHGLWQEVQRDHVAASCSLALFPPEQLGEPRETPRASFSLHSGGSQAGVLPGGDGRGRGRATDWQKEHYIPLTAYGWMGNEVGKRQR